MSSNSQVVSYIRLPTVALLSIFHVAIPTLLSTKGLLDFRQVKQTHSHSFLQAVFQVLSAAATEYHGKWVAGRKIHEKKKKIIIRWKHLSPVTLLTFKHTCAQIRRLCSIFYPLTLDWDIAIHCEIVPKMFITISDDEQGNFHHFHLKL